MRGLRSTMDKFPLCLALALSLLGCGAETQGPDSNTNWLSRCVEDDDCRGGLSCLCNTCTVACDGDRECRAAGAGVECTNTDELACQTPGSTAPNSVCADSEMSAPRDGGGGQDDDGGDGGGGDGPSPASRPEDGAPATPISSELCDGQPYSDPFAPGYTPSGAMLEEASALLAEMSLEQKVMQLTGGGEPDYNDPQWDYTHQARDDAELGIRGHLWQSGSRGVCLEDLPARDARFATSFPVGVAQGASFDLDLVSRVGRAIGDEAAAAGGTVLLAPTLAVLRHPLWGRAQESFGEDAFHIGRTGSAFAAGAQTFISACAGHFVANNIEAGQYDNDALLDEQTLREVYARPFEMVVRDGGIGCIMAAYNAVNGVKSTENEHVLREVLREDFGFRGMVISDWWAMTAPERGHGPSDPPEDGIVASEAITATLDVEIPWAVNYDALPALVSDGALDEDPVDHAVARVLEQKLRFQTAYLEEPIGRRRPTTEYDASGAISNPEPHLELAEELAEKSMVLLRNEANVLPLTGISQLAVIGARVTYVVSTDDPPEAVFDFAQDAAMGDRGSNRVRIDPALAIGPFDGITAAAGDTVVTTGTTAEAAADADVAIVVVGLTPGDEGEEYTGVGDREDLSLGEVQNQLVADVVALGKPVVVVVEAGGAVDMPWLEDVSAVIMAWYPGQVGGAALGNLLFGRANFSGRLPVTWPESLAQLPTFDEGTATEMDYYAGYRRFHALGLDPLFSFGHGLSYSQVAYNDVSTSCGAITRDSVIALDVELEHVSGPRSEEVVMVFASYPETRARRSVKELKAFARVETRPGEVSRVTIPVRVQDLKYFDEDANEWIVESGPVVFQIGPNAENLPLTEVVELE